MDAVNNRDEIWICRCGWWVSLFIFFHLSIISMRLCCSTVAHIISRILETNIKYSIVCYPVISCFRIYRAIFLSPWHARYNEGLLYFMLKLLFFDYFLMKSCRNIMVNCSTNGINDQRLYIIHICLSFIYIKMIIYNSLSAI